MNDALVKIIYFHEGKIPVYLRRTLESARVFNPESEILLICDQPVNLDWIQVRQVPIDSLHSELLNSLLTSYKHISGLKVYYELLFLRRWFYLDELIRKENIPACVLCDSDFMIFESVDHIAANLPRASITSSEWGNPSFTLIRGRIEGFLNFILAKYSDQEFLHKWEQLSQEAAKVGGLNSLGDMVFLKEYLNTQPDAKTFSSRLACGHLDYNINDPEGMDYKEIRHRKRKRKNVYWQRINGLLKPYFREQVSGRMIPTLGIHYQSGTKRLISRFNLFGRAAVVPASLRDAYYNWSHKGPFSEWL